MLFKITLLLCLTLIGVLTQSQYYGTFSGKATDDKVMIKGEWGWSPVYYKMSSDPQSEDVIVVYQNNRLFDNWRFITEVNPGQTVQWTNSLCSSEVWLENNYNFTGKTKPMKETIVKMNCFAGHTDD